MMVIDVSIENVICILCEQLGFSFDKQHLCIDVLSRYILNEQLCIQRVQLDRLKKSIKM